jgi:F-type H+-transporting ATPase subunit epsilon
MAQQLQCIVVTPEATVQDEPADFVVLPLYDGEIGIAPSHTPMIGRLGYGEMRIVAGGKTSRFYVDGGFAQISGDVISVLTNRAVPADELEAAAAQTQLDEAIAQPAHSAEAITIRDRAVSQARAQLRVARRAHG